MSNFGPEIEQAPFDYEAAYGDESNVAYTDAGLFHLVYQSRLLIG